MARRFVDARGTEWEVWEVGARPPLADTVTPPRRRPAAGAPADARWLRFESATQRRRLAPYPERWEALDAGALAALCAAATVESPKPVRRLVMPLADAPWLGEG